MNGPHCRRCWWTIIAGLWMLLAGDARAQQSAELQVLAIVQPGCSIDGLGTAGHAGTLGALDFGSAGAFSSGQRTAALVAAPAIVLRCTPGVALSMTVDGGHHALAGERRLQRQGGGGFLPYRLFRDGALAQPVAIGVPYGVAVSAATMNDVRLPLHASVVLPGAGVPAGHYADVLLVTLSW